MTTEGLNKEGFPVSYKREFNLKQDRGVQYYVEWINNEQQHDITVKWFNPNDQLISFLRLNSFSKNIVRDYISFSKKKSNQLVLPKVLGYYSVYLYIDNELISITKFKLKN